MGCIEPLIVLPVAAFHLAVMPWRIGTDYLVPDAVLLQTHLEKGGLIPVGGEAVGKFGAVIRLDALNQAGEGFHKVFHKQCGGIGAVLFKGFHKAPPGILVNGGILEKMFADNPAVHKAGRGDEFHIHLYTLSGMVHLLIRLRDIFGVRGMESHNALLFEEAVKTGDGAGVTALHEFNPENDEAGIRVTSAHIEDEFDFVRGVLVGMMVGPAGEVTQGVNGTVKASFPAVNVLPVGFISDGSFGNPIFFSVFNKR